MIAHDGRKVLNLQRLTVAAILACASTLAPVLGWATLPDPQKATVAPLVRAVAPGVVTTRYSACLKPERRTGSVQGRTAAGDLKAAGAATR